MDDSPPPAEAAGPRLAPCPATPNCVSSQAVDAGHRVEPLPLIGTPGEALARLRRIIEEMPRTRVVETRADYLRAEFRSRIFRFTDDLEILVDEEAGVLHVRSASRIGRSDWGVNRRRVEALRLRLTEP